MAFFRSPAARRATGPRRGLEAVHDGAAPRLLQRHLGKVLGQQQPQGSGGLSMPPTIATGRACLRRRRVPTTYTGTPQRGAWGVVAAEQGRSPPSPPH